ncbi:hypothetical protein CPB86DRAFT_820529 [Serendipita vermifera]|nr:hypothetical protein CPB86DRAFT_820529 [Serendipita vermifera]
MPPPQSIRTIQMPSSKSTDKHISKEDLGRHEVSTLPKWSWRLEIKIALEDGSTIHENLKTIHEKLVSRLDRDFKLGSKKTWLGPWIKVFPEHPHGIAITHADLFNACTGTEDRIVNPNHPSILYKAGPYDAIVEVKEDGASLYWSMTYGSSIQASAIWDLIKEKGPSSQDAETPSPKNHKRDSAEQSASSSHIRPHTQALTFSTPTHPKTNCIAEATPSHLNPQEQAVRRRVTKRPRLDVSASLSAGSPGFDGDV